MDKPPDLVKLSFSTCKLGESNSGSRIIPIEGLLEGLKELIYVNVTPKSAFKREGSTATQSIDEETGLGRTIKGHVAINSERKGWT